MRKRRIAAMALTLVLTAGTIFSGCGNEKTEDTAAKSETGGGADEMEARRRSGALWMERSRRSVLQFWREANVRLKKEIWNRIVGRSISTRTVL
ncbi:MAG: hypothetical protein ACLUOI_09045 [Eisenbergiella sp.]